MEVEMHDTDSGADDTGVAAPPRKRGRPANPGPKVVKVPSGRGRGRPSKKSGPKSVVKPSPDANGAKAGRGRPPKGGKPKVPAGISPTGRGRGRPKKPKPESNNEDDDDDEDERSEDEAMEAEVTPRKVMKKIGRPKKRPQSDDEASGDEKPDDDEPRPVGRPNTGAINLNISRSGRGVGRPKKVSKAVPNGSATGKRPGRPPSGKSPVVRVPTGNPRGRPRSFQNTAPVQGSDEDSVTEKEDRDDIVEEGDDSFTTPVDDSIDEKDLSKSLGSAD